MIKCDGFGRLLKQGFFTLLTSCFILLGGSFVSSYKIQPIGLTSSPSVINNNYNITFLKGGGLLSNFLSSSKGILALDSNILFWWTPNGFPYVYAPNFQGFYDRYFSCDPFTGLDSTLNGCSSLPLSYSGDNSNEIEVFKNFFSKVVAGDYVYYNYVDYRYVGATYMYYTYYLDICFSSEEIGKSLCFLGGRCSSDRRECQGGMTNSQNYSDLNFGNIPYSSIGYAPGQNGYGGQFDGNGGQGVITGSVNNEMTGSYILDSCTNLDALDYMASGLGMGTTVCYGGLDGYDILSGIDLITVKPNPTQGETVFDIFQHTNNGMNFEQWFNFWKTTYVHRYTSNNLFLDKPTVLYTYFDLLDKYGSQFTARQVQEYCRFIVGNVALTGDYKGSVFSCRDVNKYIEEENSNDEGSSDSAIGVNWNGIGSFGNGSGSGVNGTKSQSNAVVFIQDVFNVLSEAVPTDFSGIGGGFLPGYIIMFLLAIILFRFIAH